MNQAIIVNYKILVLPIDTVAQYFSSHANSCLPREGWNWDINNGSRTLMESKSHSCNPNNATAGVDHRYLYYVPTSGNKERTTQWRRRLCMWGKSSPFYEFINSEVESFWETRRSTRIINIFLAKKKKKAPVLFFVYKNLVYQLLKRKE